MVYEIDKDLVQEFMGLSTDVKPLGLYAGSTFYETDTGNVYTYLGAWVIL